MALQGETYPQSNRTGAYIGSASGGQFVSYRPNPTTVGPLPSYNPAYNGSPYTPPRPATTNPTYQLQQPPRSSNININSPYSPEPVDSRVILIDSGLPYTVLERRDLIPRSTGASSDMSSMMSFFTQVAKITDNLFLCAAAAVTHANIKQHGITNVINLTMDVPSIKDPYVETTRVSVDDVPHANLGIYFDRLADKIRQVKERGGRTLVHCVAGVSRSASTCIAYLMKYYRMSLAESYRYVKGRRPVIRPNVGFFRQLIDYERKLFGKNSVRMVESAIGYIPDVYKEETRGMVFLNPSPAAGSSRRGYNSSHFGR